MSRGTHSRFAELDPAAYALPPELARRLCSPALVVFLPAVRENIRRVLALAGDEPRRWRPHVKTLKTPELIAELVRAGIVQFKCATVREARAVLQATGGRVDLLVAYPHVSPALGQLAALAAAHPAARIAVLCEDAAGAAAVPEPLGLFVDVDPGMHRTGVSPERRERIRATVRRAGGRLGGLHWYDGHVSGSDAGTRRAAAWAGYDRLLELVAELEADGAPIPEVVTSGTPAFRYALEHEGLGRRGPGGHRVSPGTVVLHDLRSEQELDDLDLLPAALLFSRVVSCPAPGRVTCDAGSKSLAAEAGDPAAFVLGRPDLEALTPSEEHLPLRVRGGRAPERGEELWLIPRHVCPTVNLAETMLLVDGERSAPVAVAARAHDLHAEREPS
jgi:D-serine deaminase-like pyridoxal phosphate-dependent protein